MEVTAEMVEMEEAVQVPLVVQEVQLAQVVTADSQQVAASSDSTSESSMMLRTRSPRSPHLVESQEQVVLVEMQAHQETSLLELALLVVKVVQEVLVVLHTLADSQVITLASLLIRS
jgi:hypothetical protein